MENKAQLEKIMNEVYNIPENIPVPVYNRMGGLPAFEPIFECMEQAYDLGVSANQAIIDTLVTEISVLREQVSEWVSIDSDVKPQDDEWVLVASPIQDGRFDVHLTACSYSEKYNDFTGYGEAQRDGRVTHWMPLPPKPEAI